MCPWISYPRTFMEMTPRRTSLVRRRKFHATTWFAAQWIAQRIGGYTGDTLGAVQQLAELVFLVVAALFIAH